MKINISSLEEFKLDDFIKTHNYNVQLLTLLSRFLNNYDCLVSPSLFKEVAGNSSLSEEYVYALVVNSLNSADDREFFSKYLINSIKKQDANEYLKENYRIILDGLTVLYGNWFISKSSYLPYQGFVFNDLEVDKENYYRINSNIGFFENNFSYPSIKQNGREWMSLNPNEINTMKTSIDSAKGNVLVGGLGLGYYIYAISNKDSVKNITVIEKDCDVINFFKKYLLDKFPWKEKIQIVESDIFEFIKQNDLDNFDYSFMDIWHDTGDGLDLYLKLKNQVKIPCDFWIEKSLIAQLRLMAVEVFLDLKDNTPFDDSYTDLENIFYNDLNDRIFSSYDEVFEYFSDYNLLYVANKINN